MKPLTAPRKGLASLSQKEPVTSFKKNPRHQPQIKPALQPTGKPGNFRQAQPAPARQSPSKQANSPRQKPATSPAKSPLWYTWIINSWIFIPAVLYLNTAYQYACNIPVLDDYDVILAFLHDFKAAGFGQKLLLLISQHNEHRLLHSRLLYVAYYGITGNINFRNIILIGDLQLLAIALISTHVIRKCGGKYWQVAAFIWSLCIFDLNTYESGDMAMFGMQCFGVIMLFFGSAFLYSLNNRKYIAPAALLQAVTIFSSGNGIVASVFITLSTLPGNDRVKKIVSIATTLVFAPIYFIGYANGGLADGEGHPAFDIGKAAIFFVKMGGAHFSFDHSLIFGVLLFAPLLVAFPYRSLRRTSPLWPILCIAGFSIVSMLTISVFRSNTADAQFQTSRYQIYPQLLAATACLFVMLKLENKRSHLAVSIILLLIMFRSYALNYSFGKLGFERTKNRSETYDYWYPDKKRAKSIIGAACESGIYCLDDER